MSDAKIEIKIGELHFSAEAEQQWVAAQLDKIIAKADVLGKLAEKHAAQPAGTENKLIVEPAKAGNIPALGAFLSSKNATSQPKRFLATAGWLYLKGKKQTSTREVVLALKENQQNRLSNPSQCLNDNVKQGCCEKSGSGFFVTVEGFKQLAIPAP
jgi:hypothetical protein